MQKHIVQSLMTLCFLFSATTAYAVPINWVDWTSTSPATVLGTMGGVSVTYSGGYASADLGGGTNYWTEGSPAPYTGNAHVDNAPTAGELIRLVGATSNRVHFSTAVFNPVMAIVSMGQGGLAVEYDFDQSFTLLSEGRGYWGDGTYSEGPGDVLTGRELHAVIQFNGWVSDIKFENTYENWHGFTFGAADSAPVPEPATMLLFGIGLLALAGARRKFQK